jgi:hypothetical protein
MKYGLFIVISLLPYVCFAENKASALPPPMPELPDLPIPIQNGQEMVLPDIVIIKKKGKIIHEYRRKGFLYKVKVIPDIGLPYYYLDTDGDGRLEVQKSDLDRDLKLNQWTIFEWN